MFWSVAWAQAAGSAARPSILEQAAPILFLFAIFYFLIIRPQTKKQKKHQEFMSQLKRGDSVLTASGILGTIEGITDQWVTLEIAENVRVKMLKSQIATSAQEGTEGKQ